MNENEDKRKKVRTNKVGMTKGDKRKAEEEEKKTKKETKEEKKDNLKRGREERKKNQYKKKIREK